MRDGLARSLSSRFALHLRKDEQDADQRPPQRRVEPDGLPNRHQLLFPVGEMLLIHLAEVRLIDRLIRSNFSTTTTSALVANAFASPADPLFPRFNIVINLDQPLTLRCAI